MPVSVSGILRDPSPESSRAAVTAGHVTRIKVTGVTSPEDADRAVAAGVDMVACVLNPASQRFVTTERVWEIRRALRGRALFVGVFADLPDLLVQRLMDHCQFDCAQLFGSEPKSVVDVIRPRAFKAVSVCSEAEADLAVRTYGSRRPTTKEAPALLLSLVDGSPPGIAAAALQRLPTILAASGGDPGILGHGLASARPWGVDVWDAVESSPGHLDPMRLEALVAAVREADAAAPRG